MGLTDPHPSSRACAQAAAAAILAARCLAAPPAATAQTVLRFQPSLSLTQMYDTNLFFAPSAPQADFITRITPEATVEYRSPVWNWTGGYAFDFDRFAEREDLTRADARQQMHAGLEYRLGQRTAATAAGTFARTQTPGDLIPETGLGFARVTAQRIDGRSSLTHRVNQVTAAAGEYRFTEDRIAGGPVIRTHGAAVSAERRTSARDTVAAAYRLRQFEFGPTTSTSHALNVAWTRSISERASLTLAGGPNVTDATVHPDLTASLRNRFKAADVTLAYARAQTTVFGFADVVQTQSLSATAVWSFRRSFQIRAAPAVYQSRREGLHADVFRMTAGAVWPVSRSVSVEVSFDATRQRGVLLAGLEHATIPRYLASVRLVAAPASGRR